MTDPGADMLLPISLSAAVPLWIETLKHRPWKDIAARLPELADMIASHGDDILYRSKKRGETAKAFNGLAILSFAPGGVRAFGAHWESRHPEQSVPGPMTNQPHGAFKASSPSDARCNVTKGEDEHG
jgi:hypothetical protein